MIVEINDLAVLASYVNDHSRAILGRCCQPHTVSVGCDLGDIVVRDFQHFPAVAGRHDISDLLSFDPVPLAQLRDKPLRCAVIVNARVADESVDHSFILYHGCLEISGTAIKSYIILFHSDLLPVMLMLNFRRLLQLDHFNERLDPDP